MKIPQKILSRIINRPHDPALLERAAAAFECTRDEVELALHNYNQHLRVFQPRATWSLIIDAAEVGVLGDGSRRAPRYKGAE